jgi:hypothetical protein
MFEDRLDLIRTSWRQLKGKYKLDRPGLTEESNVQKSFRPSTKPSRQAGTHLAETLDLCF